MDEANFIDIRSRQTEHILMSKDHPDERQAAHAMQTLDDIRIRLGRGNAEK